VVTKEHFDAVNNTVKNIDPAIIATAMDGFSRPLITMTVYFILVLIVGVTLYQLHKSAAFKDFTLLDLIAEGGKLSGRKFFETGAFFITSIGFILQVTKAGMSEGLLLTYGGLWIISRTAGQIIHAKQNNEITKEGG